MEQIHDEPIAVILQQRHHCKAALLSITVEAQHHRCRVELHLDDITFVKFECSTFIVHCCVRVRKSVSAAAVKIVAVSKFLPVLGLKFVGMQIVLRRQS
jgi:hypothetical protein